MKRFLDIVISLGALIALSPLMLLTAIGIKLSSKGPVLYRSKRVGRNYEVFDFLKFRTMRVNTDEYSFLIHQKNQYELEQSPNKKYDGKIHYSHHSPIGLLEDGANDLLFADDYAIKEEDFLDEAISRKEISFVKIENDPRIFWLGRILRKYSIDELPQLVNILRGDMSLVGNRPLPLYEAETLTTDRHIDRFLCEAGLTGLWQVSKRGDNGSMSSEERKQLDVRYAREANLWLDIRLFFRTFGNFIQKGNV